MGYNLSDWKKIYLKPKYAKVNKTDNLTDAIRWYGISCLSIILNGK